jgi:NADH dehydrogenase
VDRLFVTGGSGFVGSRLLPALERGGHAATALDRTGVIPQQSSGAGALQVVRGDLLEPHTYRAALASSTVVLHLAATTGRATKSQHFRVNTHGTEILLHECESAGVRKFLFVSSIAAGFTDRRDYHYAEAKVRAEDAVRRSNIPFAILRPTMILGPGSAVRAGLERLALLPVVPVFGDGRTIVQPLHVDDVVRAIMDVVEQDKFENATYEIGGPELLTIEELLQRIREARRGSRGRVIHIPTGLLRGPLRVAETVGLTGLLPVTAGQLSSFRSPGVATANWLQDTMSHRLRGLPDMLAAEASPNQPADELPRECRVFAAHLLRAVPDDYVTGRYVEAHRVLSGLTTADAFEVALLRFARTHRVAAAIADAYARVFVPASVLRKKLVLLLALLETSAATYRLVDAPVQGGPAAVAARLVARGSVAVMWLAAGILLFGPARLILTARAR